MKNKQNKLENDLESNNLIIEPNFNFSRRDFLRGLFGGAAMLALGFDLRAQKTLEKNNGRKLGVALLGLGRYASGEIGPALRQTKLCELKGVITGTPARF